MSKTAYNIQLNGYEAVAKPSQILYNSVSNGGCIVTSPERHNKVINFASLISARLATLLDVNFYGDLNECLFKHRVGVVFPLCCESPQEKNIIVFDNFVTTGLTMSLMSGLLQPLGYNLVFFTGRNNKL